MPIYGRGEVIGPCYWCDEPVVSPHNMSWNPLPEQIHHAHEWECIRALRDREDYGRMTISKAMKLGREANVNDPR